MFNTDMELNEWAPAYSPPLRDNSVRVIIADCDSEVVAHD
jgi:hypothetical protein